MKPFVLLLLLIALASPRAAGAQDAASTQDTSVAQSARIESAEVSGFPFDQLSPGLRHDIEALAGEAFDRASIDRLAGRIEEEHPDVVTAVRSVARPDGRVRVIFLVARISEDEDLASNINARYTIESVAIDGVEESSINKGLWDRLQALVGGRLDQGELDRLRGELASDQPGYDVKSRVSRGSRQGQLRIVFEFEESERLRWIPFTRSRSKYVYHGEQGWSGVQDIPMGNRNHHAIVGFAFSNSDDRVEEYSGVRLGVESRRLGTDRLGARVEVSWLNDTWRDATLTTIAANPAIPEPYRKQISVEPSITVAVDPFIRFTGGLSISELQSRAKAPDSQMANAFVAAVDVRRSWSFDDDDTQRVEAGYQLRSATTALESDLIYKRHLGHAMYRYDRGPSTVLASALFGGITGTAPLFERFTLGDSMTLRGWDKFDIAPAGGDRLFHQSLEYRYHHLALFLDSGAVWDNGTDKKLRLSTGFGYHDENSFVTVGVPLNADGVSAVFMMGVRF
jgi:hypothetical protein